VTPVRISPGAERLAFLLYHWTFGDPILGIVCTSLIGAGLAMYIRGLVLGH
jgi:hypothetical protein